MVLAQYYNFVRFGKAGYRMIMEIMQENAEQLAAEIASIGPFQIIGKGEETLPLVAFNSPRSNPTTSSTSRSSSAERGWMLPAYTMPPDANDVKMMRAFVKVNPSRHWWTGCGGYRGRGQNPGGKAWSPPPSGRRTNVSH